MEGDLYDQLNNKCFTNCKAKRNRLIFNTRLKCHNQSILEFYSVLLRHDEGIYSQEIRQVISLLKAMSG